MIDWLTNQKLLRAKQIKTMNSPILKDNVGLPREAALFLPEM